MAEKLGLALSGGGFRASFYHIGVLAQMAEQHLLKDVEVISTVSGGSIIGALYYLHVKKLLESCEDSEIEDADYIELVKDVEHDFFQGTQKNIRMRTFSDLGANFKMLSASYSRSDRLAELYNEHFYKDVLEGVSCPQMQYLTVQPKDGITNNTQRKAKIPTIVINATTLNTGGNWQFTAEKMGEYPIDKDKDSIIVQLDRKKIRLRRPNSYAELPTFKGKMPWDTEWNHRDVTLGEAVAASACVPGLFTPFSITGLYKYNASELSQIGLGDENSKNEIEITPLLVDGGVFDNQGIHGLKQNDCTHFVISDACGQIGVDEQMTNDATTVLLRVSSVLQDRLRSECLEELSKNNAVAFMDLRHGLGALEIATRNSTKGNNVIESSSLKEFGVHPKVQDNLSLMRTDLDAFNEVEAYSLMIDGYLMSKKPLKKLVSFDNAISQPSIDWAFKKIAPYMENPSQGNYLQQLNIAQMVPFKFFARFPYQVSALLFLIIAPLCYVLVPMLVNWLKSFTGYDMMLVLLPILILGILSAVAPKIAKFFAILQKLRPLAEFFKRLIGFIVLIVISTWFCKFYLRLINSMFLAQGTVDNLRNPKSFFKLLCLAWKECKNKSII